MSSRSCLTPFTESARAGTALAVLDPTWPQPFRGIAADQVEAAVSGGMVGPGDMVVFVDGPRLGIATCAVGGGQGLALAVERVG